MSPRTRPADEPFLHGRVSLLDRSRTRVGEEPGRALRDTVAAARAADDLGYHRFWVAEHHSVPGVAGSAPTVLAAAVAAATRGIRVGTGGVMLPNHSPFVVAEQFGVLESLFTGRIDVGVGRSVGFTEGVRRALGHDREDADRFEEQLAELLDWFDGTRAAHPGVHARPAEGLRPPVFVLATGEGAGIAARAGLPLVVGDLRRRARVAEIVERYREEFKPGPRAEHPHVVISGTVAIADTEAAAHRILAPEARSTAYAAARGEFPPLIPAEEVDPSTMGRKERERYEDALTGHIVGTETEVAAALERAVADTGADELLITTSAHDRAALADSTARLARLLGLRPRTPTPAAGAPAVH
ncbi:MsnO8 family LLM class oxidoreductase [Streptomyces sp. BI20]|uniref:MsnO8 family LLM class oxidoreductase n=1 Tax=Streptomyces sp. BI20 TaxID=3403460 RepID=UPI003C73D29D